MSKIQALVRSFLARRRMLRSSRFFRHRAPPPAMKRMRTEYFALKLGTYSAEAISDARVIQRESDALISASESALAAARKIFAEIDLGPKAAEIAPEFECARARALQCPECPVCISPFGNKPVSLLSC